MELIERWRELLADVGARDAGTTGSRLLGRWAEPHRRYHDLVHLAAVLDGIDLLADHAADVHAVRLAAWYHDAVYQGTPADEEQSARLAESDLSTLGLPGGLIAEVARLVRLTARHDPAPGDRNGETLCDADLAVLAGDAGAYRRYTAAIRAEFAHVPDDQFRAGRATILIQLLALPSLFSTPAGRQRWEAAARANLEAELRELTG